MVKLTSGAFRLLFLLTIPFLFNSCKEIDELTKFDMEYDSKITIESSTLLFDTPISFSTPDVQTNSESTFESNNTKKDLVEAVTLKNASLTVAAPDHGDFGFLKSIEVFLKAEGLPEIKVAWKSNIPDDAGNQLNLETSPENLREYIVQDKFTLKVTTVTDETINADHEIAIKSLFHVDAKILGI